MKDMLLYIYYVYNCIYKRIDNFEVIINGTLFDYNNKDSENKNYNC